MLFVDKIRHWLGWGKPPGKRSALPGAFHENHFARMVKKILNDKGGGKERGDNRLPTYKGLSIDDIKDWGRFISEGKLKAVDETSARQMLQFLIKLQDEVEAFLKDHKRTLETGKSYEDQFKEALDNYIKNINNQIQALTKRAQSGLMTEDDLHRLNDLAIVLGQQSKLGLDYLKPKKDSPQEQLLNNLGIWLQEVARLREQYGIRPAPGGPMPGPRPVA